jgi:ATP-dependent DNA ligase
MAQAASFPEWLVPMAATLTQERFSGPDWIFERKFDGIRLIAYKRDGDVQLFSRKPLTTEHSFGRECNLKAA